MSRTIRIILTRCAETMQQYFTESVAFCLLCIPLAVFLVWTVICLFSRSARRSVKIPFVYTADVVLLLFVAAALCSAFPFVAVLAIAAVSRAVYLILYGVLCLFRSDVKKQSKSDPQKTIPVVARQAEEKYFIKNNDTEPQKPRFVRCCGGEEHGISVGQDVRLEHVFSVLERLKSMPLGAGDRLEAERCGEMLSAYRNQGQLDGVQSRALNDILASLLKMMAKYDF